MYQKILAPNIIDCNLFLEMRWKLDLVEGVSPWWRKCFMYF